MTQINVVFTRKSVDCLACCICHCSAKFRQDNGFDPACGSHQLPVFPKYSVRLQLRSSAESGLGQITNASMKKMEQLMELTFFNIEFMLSLRKRHGYFNERKGILKLQLVFQLISCHNGSSL